MNGFRGLRIAVFASGKGSNFAAILKAVQSGSIPHSCIALAVSNNSQAGALDFARHHGIPARHISRKQFPSEQAYTDALLHALREHDVNFIALAGYMKMIAPSIIAAYSGAIVNIHPGLLPEFGGPGMYGMHVHEAVIASGAKESGATVHLVDNEYDRGPIVAQRRVPVLAGDTAETLAARVLAVEHELYPEVIRWFAEGRVTIADNRVSITGNE
jgi:phosphoribosylglycinamide formyltransferase 1